jgi:PAS domain S-box-containing protein
VKSPAQIKQMLGIQADSEFSGSGIAMVNGQPMMMAVEPILRTDGTGPAAGELVFGRYIDAAELARYEVLTFSTVTLQTASGDMPDEFAKAYDVLQKEPYYTHLESQQRIAGYGLVNGQARDSALLLRVSVSRDNYILGQKTAAYYVVAAIIVALLLAGVMLILLQKQILARIMPIMDGLRRVSVTGDVTQRVPVTGSDEVSAMGETINGMLASIQKSSNDLRERDNRLTLMRNNVRDVIFVTDMHLKVSSITPGVEELIGYKSEEFVGTSIARFVAPESMPTAMAASEEEVKFESQPGSDPNRARTLEVEIIAKDGSRKWVDIRSTFIRDNAGKATGVMGVVRDISERKERERLLQDAYQKEAALSKQLQEEIDKRMDYTRALVHELKTPITPILAGVDLLKDEVKEPGLKTLVESITRGAENLNRRVDELLDLARGEMNLLLLRPELFQPEVLLRDIHVETMPLAQRNGQVLALEVEAGLPAIEADRDRIRQVILNLLGNALKLTPAGGKITMESHRHGNSIVISVSDTGPGISEEAQKGLFNPYYRTEVDRRRLGGLGLGLALAKNFIELHGGRIWVNSKKGTGSTFAFSLPLALHQRDAETSGGKS